MSEVKFEPFQKVLVRDNENQEWKANLFSHECTHVKAYVCSGFTWNFCIPYEGNEHLLGTTDDPTPPEPEFHWGEKVMVHDEIQDGEEPAIYLCETGHAVLPHMVIIKGQKTPCRMKECRRFDWEDAWKK